MNDGNAARLAEDIGRNVAAARNALGWTQSELAERSRTVNRSVIAKLESHNSTSISVSTLAALAEAFNIPPYMLLLGNADWQKLAKIASSLSAITNYIFSPDTTVSSEEVEKIEIMARSSSKRTKRQAIAETNTIVARMFGIKNTTDGTADIQRARTAGTAIATAMVPNHPIINGAIASIISS